MKDEIARIGVQAHAVKSAPMKHLWDAIKTVLGADEPRVNWKVFLQMLLDRGRRTVVSGNRAKLFLLA
jgi:hypothetical protein